MCYILYMEFGKKLKLLRKAKGVKQKEVADFLGVTLGAYAHYEHGTREPAYQTLVMICKYYKVSSDYLLGLED